MAQDHRRLAEEVVQGVLLDDPGFLREIVERVLQELLEAEMDTHIGAALYERSSSRKGHRNGYKARTLRTRVGTLKACSFPRIGQAPSPQGSSSATRGTRRLWFWL